MKTYSILCLTCIALLTLLGCENPTSATTTDSSRPTAADVQRFVGTAAFQDAKSASITVTVGTSASALFSTSSTLTVGGSILYEGVTLTVTGNFNTSTGALSATASGPVSGVTTTFTLSGTYTPTDGFSGTITRTISGTTVNGAVALLEIAKTENTTIVENFRGTFGGSASGSWNVTTRDSTATGTWMLSDGQSRGTLRGTRSGNTVTVTARDTNNTAVTQATTGTISGTSISGTWADDQGGSGTWSGTKD